jgi:hypothetical protein
VIVEGSRPRGRLFVSAGREPDVLDDLSLEGRSGGPTGAVLALPVRVQSLTVRGDEAARLSVGALTLVPRQAGPAPGVPRGAARRAVRSGALRVFFFDDRAFAEPPGFWTRGDDETALFVDARPPDGGAPARTAVLRLRAGVMPVSVDLATGAWRAVIALHAGQTREVALPASGAGWPLRVRTRGGFRPAWHDPASGDLRHLGVWIEAAPLVPDAEAGQNRTTPVK